MDKTISKEITRTFIENGEYWEHLIKNLFLNHRSKILVFTDVFILPIKLRDADIGGGSARDGGRPADFGPIGGYGGSGGGDDGGLLCCAGIAIVIIILIIIFAASSLI